MFQWLRPGTHSKSLIDGADCPEGATFLDASFLGEGTREATVRARATCVFEQNTGMPLRRHMSYSREYGPSYGGMSDSVLVVRSILAIVNYDYIVDFVFHQVRAALATHTLHVIVCVQRGSWLFEPGIHTHYT